MFKKIITLTLFLFSANVASQNYLESSTPKYSVEGQVHCSSRVKAVLETIQKLPRANDLIEEVLKKGPLYIKINHVFSRQFEGYWSSENRTVYLTKSDTTSQGALITTLLFELHNALRDSDLQELDLLAYQRQISKGDYIDAVEYIEYQNAQSTSAILEEGIAKDIFPLDSRWILPDNFEDHLSTQKRMGHSAWIGKIYDYLTSA